MNVIAIMNHMGVYFKEEPIRELHRALERLDFRIERVHAAVCVR